MEEEGNLKEVLPTLSLRYFSTLSPSPSPSLPTPGSIKGFLLGLFVQGSLNNELTPKPMLIHLTLNQRTIPGGKVEQGESVLSPV